MKNADRALLIGAIGLGGFFVWRLVRPMDVPTPNAALKSPDSSLFNGDRLGAEGARQTIVVFTDYECPACKRLDASLDTLLRDSPGTLSVIYRHFPGPQNDHSKPAARAAICAGRQGAFASYHRALFAVQDSLGSLGWSEIARRSSVHDLGLFSSCLDDSVTANRIYRDLGAGMSLRLAGTPATVVGSHLYVGALPTRVLKLLLDQEERRR